MAAKATIQLRGILLSIPFLLHLALVDLLISLLLPVSFIFPQWSYFLSSQLAAGVWSHLQNIFVHNNGANIIHSKDGFLSNDVDGKGRPQTFVGEPALVISNHAAWSDFYMLQSLALSTTPQMLPFARYFAKASLRYVPLLGWGLWALRMPLVSRRWVEDRAEIERVFRGPRERGELIWLVMFSEGTRWTKRKWEQGVAWARSKGRPEPGRYVLAPRSKGFVAAVKGLRDGGVDSVVDVTIAYATKKTSGTADGPKKEKWEFMAIPDMWTTMSRPNLSDKYAFWVHAERFDVKSLPRGDDELEKWLEQRWVKKAQRLDALGSRVDAGKDVSLLCL